ncbi:HD domain-containing protein [Acinetobacter radioresistens]|uniref:HD domain-containing protein n=1 Tax=Acinetobacter radioresistens TaxID=40216 RepID=UPI002005FF0E|nr:metal-dependent hydrolase [Acinetobacter radioresistens]MCK4103356.1 metal-dependent hydrolase [Acinetobacter radioresistens]
MQPNLERLKQYWQELQQTNALYLSDSLLQKLMTAYQEPQRYYHTLQHIEECLDLYQPLKMCVNDPLAVELAIWFHDVVYEPKSDQNELKSAELMKQSLAPYMTIDQISKIYSWILATQTHELSEDDDLDLKTLLDIDLAILGSKPSRFAEYEQQIQQEYAWVSEGIYHEKRKKVLSHFYQAHPLFKTEYFQDKLENQAKINLEKVLKAN